MLELTNLVLTVSENARVSAEGKWSYALVERWPVVFLMNMCKPTSSSLITIRFLVVFYVMMKKENILAYFSDFALKAESRFFLFFVFCFFFFLVIAREKKA